MRKREKFAVSENEWKRTNERQPESETIQTRKIHTDERDKERDGETELETDIKLTRNTQKETESETDR